MVFWKKGVEETLGKPAATEAQRPVVAEDRQVVELGQAEQAEMYALNQSGPRVVLESGCKLKGKLSYDEPVQIQGCLEGELFSSTTVVIGPSSTVAAAINAENCVVMGAVSEGSITASRRVELLAGGVINAPVSTKAFLIEEGGVFNGTVLMSHPG